MTKEEIDNLLLKYDISNNIFDLRMKYYSKKSNIKSNNLFIPKFYETNYDIKKNIKNIKNDNKSDNKSDKQKKD